MTKQRLLFAIVLGALTMGLSGCARVQFEARYDDGSFVSGSGWAFGTRLDASAMSSYMEWKDGEGMMQGASSQKLTNEKVVSDILSLIRAGMAVAP